MTRDLSWFSDIGSDTQIDSEAWFVCRWGQAGREVADPIIGTVGLLARLVCVYVYC